MMFILRSSKTHDVGDKPQIIKIEALSGYNQMQLCPFKLLSDYLAVRKGLRNINEQFFVFSNRDLVKPSHIRKMLRKLLIKNNLDYRLYFFHGIRAGRATDLMEMEISIETIKKLGRWRSSAVFTYLRS